MCDLKDKVVIITGASSGIGAQTAVEFSKLGSKLVLTARREEKLLFTAEKCFKTGLSRDKVLVVPADLEDDDQIPRIVKESVQKFGTINVLVNNAGLSLTRYFRESSSDDLDKMYRINTRAPFILTKLALPYLLRTKGSVVNVSSIASLRPLPYVMAYAVAKAAQDQMMKCIALELAPLGVRVNAVSPGSFITEIFEKSGYKQSGETNQQISDRLVKAHPMARLGKLDEAAKAIVFLASDDASYTTGVVLPVDGGRYITSILPDVKPKL